MLKLQVSSYSIRRTIVGENSTLTCNKCKDDKKFCYYSDVTEHYYEKHIGTVFVCRACKVWIPANTEHALTHHDTLSAHVEAQLKTQLGYACRGCALRWTTTNVKDAIKHLHDHLHCDTTAIRDNVERDVTYESIQEPVEGSVPADPPTCLFCTGAVGGQDYTTCCNVPLHFECAVMWAISDLENNQHERCMHCRAYNVLTNRLKARFNDFHWPAQWLCKTTRMDSASRDTINAMLASDSVSARAPIFSAERYRRSSIRRADQIEWIQRVLREQRHS